METNYLLNYLLKYYPEYVTNEIILNQERLLNHIKTGKRLVLKDGLVIRMNKKTLRLTSKVLEF